MTLVERLTTQNLIESTHTIMNAAGIHIAPCCEFPEIVPDDRHWLARNDEGETYPVYRADTGWTT